MGTRMMSRFLMILLACLLIFQFAPYSPYFTQKSYAMPDDPLLSVSGIRIVDTFGNPVRLQGFNVEESDLGRSTQEEGFQWMNSKGFNYLRVELFMHRLQPNDGDHWDSTYLGRLDQLLEWCAEYHIYANLVFQQWHWSPYFDGTGFPSWVVTESGGGYSTSQRGQCAADFWTEQNAAGEWMREQWMNFWLFIINRYKANPYVIAWEIFNEPSIGYSTTSTVKYAMMDTQIEWVETVRSIDPDRIIIMHDIEARTEIYEEAVEYDNIVWTRSFYPAYDANVEVDELKLKYNTHIGTPYVISEIGIQDDTSTLRQSVATRLNRFRSLSVNDGYECYAWYLYGRYDGTYRGYVTPRDGDGDDKAIVAVLQQFMSDTTGPTYSEVAHNTTLENQPCAMSCKFQDDTDLSHAVASYNGTGSWVNETASSLATNPCWSNFTKDLPGSGTVVAYRWHANDTSDNWVTTSTYTFTTTSSQGSIVVLLNLPSDGANKRVKTISFTYTPVFYQSIENASVYLNLTGVWQIASSNTSVVTNDTINSISYSFTTSGVYVWNVGAYNISHLVFAQANRTLTIELEPENDQLGEDIVGTSLVLSSHWDDGEGLSGYYYSSNASGSWSNDTFATFDENPDWATKTVTLQPVVGSSFGYRWYANDTDDKWTVTNIFVYATPSFVSNDFIEYNSTLMLGGNPYINNATNIITAISYSSHVLSFTVYGASSTTSTTIVDCAVFTKPTYVHGATDWSYSYDTNLITITVDHSSEVEIEIEWPPPTVPSISKLHTDITVAEGITYRTHSNNASFIMGTDLTFYRTVINSNHVWMDQSYTAKKYTLYCLYVMAPDNASFTIHQWFPTKDSTAQLTITTPLSTDITLVLYSPNLLSASAIGVVSQEWNATTHTLAMIVNSDVNPIIITVTVTETDFNITPENVAIEITDMEGCGAWVFSESEYYTFKATFWDGDGYGDLDECKIAFSDGLHWINASYSDDTWTLDSGEDYVNLGAGTATVIGANTLQITYLIYLENTILDALDIELYQYCIDDSGAYDDWQEMETDYFNIYSLGGHSILTTSDSMLSGRLVGGDVFDLYAYNNSWVDCYMLFNDLVHVKMLPLIGYTNDLALQNWSITFYMDFCVGGNDDWDLGLKCVVHNPDAEYWFYRTTVAFHNLTADWYWNNNLVRSDTFYIYNYVSDDWTNATMNLWFDFWINKENASSIIGGRLNAYYFPMKDSAHAWLRWLTGSNWGIDEAKRKQTMYFETMVDNDGDTIYSKEVTLIKFGCRVDCGSDETNPVQVKISDFDIFDFTLGNRPLEGISTPVFDETKVPVMPQGGFLGALYSGLKWLGDEIVNALGPGLLRWWESFVAFMDTIFALFGWPNGFSQIMIVITNFISWVTPAITYFVSFVVTAFTWTISIFSYMVQALAQVVATLTAIVSQLSWMWAQVATGWGWVLDLASKLLPVIAIFYIFWLLTPLLDQGNLRGTKERVEDTLGYIVKIGMFLWKLVDSAIDVIYRLIEVIPVVE